MKALLASSIVVGAVVASLSLAADKPAASGPATTKPAIEFRIQGMYDARGLPGLLKKDVGTKYIALVWFAFQPPAMTGAQQPANADILQPPPAAVFPSGSDNILTESGLSLDQVVSAALKSSGDAKLLENIRTYGDKVIVLANTAEEAQEGCQKLLTALSQWWPKNAPKLLESAIAKQKKLLADAEKNGAEKQKPLDAVKESLGGLEFNKNTNDELHLKRLFVEVDLAGVRARIESADTLLKGMGGDSNTEPRRTTEIIRTQAQIELAGLLAQKKVLGDLIDTLKKIPKLEAELSQAQHASANAKNALDHLTGLYKGSFNVQVPAKAEIVPLDWKPITGPEPAPGVSPYGADPMGGGMGPAMPGGPTGPIAPQP